MLKKFVFKKISTVELPKSSKLYRNVNKVTKLCHARYKCNNKRDPKIINLNKMAIPKKAYLLSRGVATCTQIRNCVPENNNKNK